MPDQSTQNKFIGAVGGIFHDGIPKFSRNLAILVAVLSVIAFFGGRDVLNLLALVPGNTISRFHFWNIFTSGYVQASLFTVIFDSLLILVCGAFFEPIWGPKEMFKFVAIVNTTSGIMTFFLVLLLFFLTGSERLLYFPFFGPNAILAGYIVAMKQFSPEIVPFLGSTIRTKHFPFIFLVISFIGSFLSGWNQFPFTVFGLYTSWFYLRFFQKRMDGVGRGDPNESFSFASMFPEIIRPFVQVVSNLSFKCANVVGFSKLTTPSGDHLLGGNVQRTYVAGYNTLDRDRRRNLAIRSLEGRLEELKSTQQDPSVPSSSSSSSHSKAPLSTPQDDAVSVSTSSSTSESKDKM